MTLPFFIPLLLSIAIFLNLFLFLKERKRSRNLKTQLENYSKNNSYKENLIREIQDNIEYGKELENAINTLITSIDKTFPYSTLSSMYAAGHKVIFHSLVKEKVNPPFIDHIKNTMLEAISNPENLHREIEENITGVPFDNLSNSQTMSSFDVKISIHGKLMAMINLSSTKPALYNGDDIKTLTTVSEIVSSLLSKMESFLDIEKGKTLSMIDSFSEGIFVIDRHQKLVEINSSAKNFLGIQTPIPTITDILSSLPSTYNFKGKIDKVIAEKTQLIEENVPRGNKIFKIIITPVLEINKPENIIGLSVLLHDTTLEKSLSQMKEDFTNIMVHELRSPLTAIKASGEFLESRADLTENERKSLICTISESSKKMLDKISLILDSAKMDAGLFSIKKTQSDLKKLVDNRIAVFTQVAKEKSITLSIDIDPNLKTFFFDPLRIDEVVNNLLSNSLKFTPSGGSIKLKATQDANNVTVSVSDTGAGIPKDKQGKLFSKFQQAPTDGQNQGTGLGLYVVKGVVEAHGGTVKLESEEDHGTTITFTLPISGNIPTSPTPVSAQPTKSPNPMSN